MRSLEDTHKRSTLDSMELIMVMVIIIMLVESCKLNFCHGIKLFKKTILYSNPEITFTNPYLKKFWSQIFGFELKF